MPIPNNGVPLGRTPFRAGRGKRPAAVAHIDTVDRMSPAQYAFLSGVLAILTAHGEEALTKSCEMVIARFGRRHSG